MNLFQKSLLLLIGVLVLAAAAGFFVFPSWFSEKYRPWRLGLDLIGGTHLVYEVDMSVVKTDDRDSIMNGLRDVIERRVNLFGVGEPQVASAHEGNAYRLIVELAGIKDVSAALEQIGSTPLLNFAEIVEMPVDSSTSQSASSTAITTKQILPTDLTGRYITSATLGQDNIGRTLFEFSLNDEGAKLFEDITARNVNKPLCILVDGAPIFPDEPAERSCPNVSEKITGGKAQISGEGITRDAAIQLVERFNAGALPAPIKLISQQTVSATLGVNSLNKALLAGLIGTLAIIMFMLIYYRFLGIFSAIALIIYIILALAIFKIGVTMSLSGIAGFVLSIGMAVDANILIFERTKEELAKGLAFTSAIEEGFKRAWTSIRDSNFTTIIAALILYYYTSSFVRGFALTLLIGVLLSMFSAITVTRSLLRVSIKNKRASPTTNNS